ncbi:MAG: hypothetical protein ACFFFB_19145, partial [Candidatus Heimdallarchaeota archaeon]
FIEFEGSNHTMVNNFGDNWEYNDWTPNSIGEISFTIHAKDNNGIWNSITGTISILEISTEFNGVTMKEITDLLISSSIAVITIAGIVLIINTTRRKRFFH